MSEKIAYAIKHYTWVQFLYVHIMSFVFRVLGVFVGNDDHLVLLSSMSGDQYTGSPRVMFEKMKTDPRFDGFRYIWAFSVPGKYETPGAEQVKINSLAYFIVALRARIWITDVNIERGLHFKKKSTIYFNAWHGTGPKKCGNSVSNRKDYDFSYVDILCVDGDYLKKVYVDSFNAREESMIWCGRPREDVLFTYSEEDKKHIRRELGIPDDKKVILYMPTWRENGNHGLDWLQWEREFEDDYVMLVRSHHEEVPQKETTPFHPYSPYAVAKLYGYWIVKEYREAYDMFCCSGILFNHESERRGENFVTRKITLAAARIAQGKQDKLYLGNLSSLRDWGYAKDYVECMWLILQNDKPEDFVIATGIQHSVREFCQLAFRYAGIELEFKGEGMDEKGYDKATGRVLVEVSPDFYRPTDVVNLLGDPTKAIKELGWNPSKTSFEELVKIMVEYDMRKVAIESAEEYIKTNIQDNLDECAVQ